MFDRWKRVAVAGGLAAAACVAWATGENEAQPVRSNRAKPQYVQRAYRIIIDTEDDDAEIVQIAHSQPTAPTAPPANMRPVPAVPTPSAPSAITVQGMPLQGMPMQAMPASDDCGHVEWRGGKPCKSKNKGCDACGDCDPCKTKHGLQFFKLGKRNKACECGPECGCSDCGCGGKTKCKEVACSTSDACGDCKQCGVKVFGKQVSGGCGKCNLFKHHGKGDECGCDDCAPEEPHHFSSGANYKHKECCNPDGSICDNVCNDKGCVRQPCPCPSNEVLTYYRCGHYGHYPTFWRAWPTGWLAYRPPIGDTMYDRFKKPNKAAAADSGDEPSDTRAPESDPELLNRMRARQNRTNNLGEQVPDNVQPRRRTPPERVPDADLPDRPQLPGKAAPKAAPKGTGSMQWNRSSSDPGIGAVMPTRGKVVRTAYIIEEDTE